MSRTAERKVQDAAASEEAALYVYGIVRAAGPLHFETTGLDERWPVHTIRHRGLAAVVSKVPPGPLHSTRGNLLAHDRVNAAVLRDHTVIPMAFGTVFRSSADVTELLRSAHDTFADVLDKMHDKVEFGLKVLRDRDEAIRAIEHEDAEVRRLKAQIVSGEAAGFAEQMEYGRRVDAALAQGSQELVDEILQGLREVCVASRCNDTVGDGMLLNAAFLVQRTRQAAFDRRVQAIARDFDGFTFKLTGPWPPYNFVAIRLKRERAG